MNITSSQQAYFFLQPLIDTKVEEFWGIALSTDKRVLKVEKLFKGTLNFCPIHPRDIFRMAITNNAHSLIIAHNHPQGMLLPSKKDIEITEKIYKAGHLLEIPLIDHIILNTNGHYSFVDNRQFPFDGC